MKSWIINLVTWLDVGFNVILGPLLNLVFRPGTYKFGSRLDTLSEVFGRNRDTCRLCYGLCRAFHWIDKKHCEKAVLRSDKHVSDMWIK